MLGRRILVLLLLAVPLAVHGAPTPAPAPAPILGLGGPEKDADGNVKPRQSLLSAMRDRMLTANKGSYSQVLSYSLGSMVGVVPSLLQMGKQWVDQHKAQKMLKSQGRYADAAAMLQGGGGAAPAAY